MKVIIDGIEYAPILKPKTVIVELLREDAEHWAGYKSSIYNQSHEQSARLYKACQKALEEQ